ncbi:MAG: glycosyltransferase [Bacteroidia bacterium]|jgi:glycosyltransferase involved in cell wall biosynthesis|nr:glycosyltransferase [Bacteroidia bacterium]
MSHTLPRISIVIPSYNQGAYIGETLESIAQQSYPNLELFVFDGGSKDNTVEIIRKYESIITYWESVPDRGQSHAINKGFDRATGYLFNWLNSDDLLEPGALFHLAELVAQHPDTSMICGSTRIFDTQGTQRYSGPVVFEKPEITLGYGQINQPSMYYRRDVWEAGNFCNEDLHLCMDLDLWMRYLIAHGQKNVVLTDFHLTAFRLHDTSKTLSLGENGFRQEIDELYTSLYENLKPYNTAQRKLITLSENYYWLWRADELMLKRQWKEARISLKKVNFFQLEPSARRRYLGVFKRLTLKK